MGASAASSVVADTQDVQHVMEAFHDAVYTNDSARLASLFIPQGSSWVSVLSDDAFAKLKEKRPGIAKVKVGQRVELDVDGNPRPIWATVTNMSGAQEPPINFSVVEADIDDSKLAPGELAVAAVGRIRIADRIADARGGKR